MKKKYLQDRAKLVRDLHSMSDSQVLTSQFTSNNPTFIAIVLNNKGEIAFVRQFNETMYNFISLPTGNIEIDQQVLDVATMELKKIIGSSVSSIERLSFAPNSMSSFCNDKIEILLAFIDSASTTETINQNVIWINSHEVWSRLCRSQRKGFDFFDKLYLDGKSTYALLIYKFLHKDL